MENSITKSNMLAEVEVAYKSKTAPEDRVRITSSNDAHRYFKSIWNENKIEHVEEIVLLMLNQANEVLGWVKISQGGVSGTVCDPKVLFQVALAANATQIMLCHNHPSGSNKPSQHDLALTKRLCEGGTILGIKVLEHIIISAYGYYSFSDEGIL